MKSPRTVLCLTAAVLFGMLVCRCFYGREQAVAVTAVTAESKEIYNSVTANGSIEAERSYAFSAQQNALAGEVYCQPGESVKAGQALWQLLPADGLRWTVELLQNAAAALAGGEDCEQVITALSEGPVIVCAPADCTLLTVPAPGQSAPAGLPYAQAVDLHALRLRVDIAEAFVADVRTGQQANITVAATGKRYAGTVQSVAPVARQAVSLTGSAGAVTVSAVLRIRDADEALRPGYSASAKIFVDEKPSAVVLPYEAIRQEGESEYVYILGADQRAHRRWVVTGYALSQAVEVAEGVCEGEAVIVDAEGTLSDGVLVEVAA